MALFGSKKSILKAAIKQVTNAREAEGAKQDPLYISAYKGFAEVIKGDLIKGEALYNWGFALLQQAKSKDEENGVNYYLDAISKFTFCLLVEPNHLGAAIDGGVAYMELAHLLKVDSNDELYDLAGEFFTNAERIQSGSAAYNLACIYALRGLEKPCQEALELSKESGSLPSIEDILTDKDMVEMTKIQWFVDFIAKLEAGPEPEIVDENAVTYDVEGKITSGKKQRERKLETEFEGEDGTIYDAEGNVIKEVENNDSVETEASIESQPDSEPPLPMTEISDTEQDIVQKTKESEKPDTE